MSTVYSINAVKILDNVSATNSAPSGASDGVATPLNSRGIPVHLMVKCTNTWTIVVYGYSKSAAEWFLLQSYSGTTSLNRSEPMEFAAGFDRFDFHLSALGGGNLTAWAGFTSEE